MGRPMRFLQIFAEVIHYKVLCWDILGDINTFNGVEVSFFEGSPNDGAGKLTLLIITEPIYILFSELQADVGGNPLRLQLPVPHWVLPEDVQFY